MRLIDADALKSECTQHCGRLKPLETETCDCERPCLIVGLINELQTIDAAPIVHAQWIDESGTIVCSDCHHKRNTADREYTMYCGHCGAKMDEKENNQ